MLITNFSSGELSKNLYGRIDLPQYFRGAAILENFDVIPTGGIKRRSGMERLLPLPEGGRLIPFVVNRGLSFLLYLIPGAIRVFKIESESITEEPAASVEGYIEQEIDEVQYAQNYDTMILVHENHAPLEARFINNTIFINILEMDFKVSAVAGENITESEKEGYENNDEQYGDNGWLTTIGNYPSVVSYFNGRLVFAGTKDNRQRIFLSAIKKPDEQYNFATKKIILSEEKQYVTVQATVLKEGEIKIAAPAIAINFVRPINEYYVDSIYFPKGTRIKNLVGDIMKLEPAITSYIFKETRIRDEIEFKKTAYNTAEEKATVRNTIEFYKNSCQAWRYNYTAYNTVFDRYYDWNNDFWIYYGVNHIIFVKWSRYRYEMDSWPTWSYSQTIVEIDKKIAGESDNRIKEKIHDILQREIAKLKIEYDDYTNNYTINSIHGNYKITNITANNWYLIQTKQEEIEEYLFNKISSTMKYLLHSEDFKYEAWYYDLPANYYADIDPFLIATENIYISFYTRKIIADAYPTPDCGFTFEIASDMNDAICWLAVNKGLIIGTENAEWIISPDVHATNVHAILNSRYGSDKVQGTAVGDATCFFQTGKKSLVEYYIPEADNHFRANNMALLSSHVLHESNAKEFDFVSSPYTRLYITREDGVMVTLLYERSTGTFAWNRITTGPEIVIDNQNDDDKKKLKTIREGWKKSNPYNSNPWIPGSIAHLERISTGVVVSAAMVPSSDGFDDVYLLVQRQEEYFLERLREAETVYLDSWQKWWWSVDVDPAVERQSLLDSYGNAAVIFDEKTNKVFKLTDDLPDRGDEDTPRYIGYPYTSLMRSMPVQKNEKMQHTNITGLRMRFIDSFMPRVRELKRMQATKITTRGEPYSGVETVDIIDGADTSAQFDILHDQPTRCCILAIYAEA